MMIKICLLLFICMTTFAMAADPAPKSECAGVGESAGGSTLGALQCCEGLTATNSWNHANIKQGCNIPPPPGTSGSCVKCGDGKCDSKNFEDKCTCAKDCPK